MLKIKLNKIKMETRMLWQISDTPKITRKLAGFSGGVVDIPTCPASRQDQCTCELKTVIKRTENSKRMNGAAEKKTAAIKSIL